MKLGVNVDHIATVRQARRGASPDPVRAAIVCQEAGADSIVAHLREDRRHIQDDDIRRLKSALRVKLNLEMAIHPSVVRVALDVCPGTVTLVPEKRKERTTESGLDLVRDRARIRRTAERLRSRGIEVSYFLDPVIRHIEAAAADGAHAVEIHTGAYAEARTAVSAEREALKIDRAIRRAVELGLKAHVGHGLDYRNTPRIARIRGIDEFNIGFSIVSESFFCGLERAVGRMRRLIRGGGPRTR